MENRTYIVILRGLIANSASNRNELLLLWTLASQNKWAPGREGLATAAKKAARSSCKMKYWHTWYICYSNSRPPILSPVILLIPTTLTWLTNDETRLYSGYSVIIPSFLHFCHFLLWPVDWPLRSKGFEGLIFASLIRPYNLWRTRSCSQNKTSRLHHARSSWIQCEIISRYLFEEEFQRTLLIPSKGSFSEHKSRICA